MNVGLEKMNVFFEGGDSPFEPGRISVEPLHRGYGITVGNSIRRILLDSVPGASVIGVKVSGVGHEFRAIPGAATDATELVLNLKEIRFNVEGDKTKVIRFLQTKTGIYTAGDLDLPAGVEVQNPEQEIINLTGEQPVEMDIYVRNGRGYLDASQHIEFEDQTDIIAIDAKFSPIVRAAFSVEQMRIGQDASFERLHLEVVTDGSIHPKDATMLAAKIAQSHFSFFDGMSDIAQKAEVFQERKEVEENLMLEMPIDDLDLSVRSYNCLKRDGFEKVGDIINLTEENLKGIHQLGKKSIEEILQKIEDLKAEIADRAKRR